MRQAGPAQRRRATLLAHRVRSCCCWVRTRAWAARWHAVLSSATLHAASTIAPQCWPRLRCNGRRPGPGGQPGAPARAAAARPGPRSARRSTGRRRGRPAAAAVGWTAASSASAAAACCTRSAGRRALRSRAARARTTATARSPAPRPWACPARARPAPRSAEGTLSWVSWPAGGPLASGVHPCPAPTQVLAVHGPRPLACIQTAAWYADPLAACRRQRCWNAAGRPADLSV